MKQNEFLQEKHGISCYSCCDTDSNITYGRQELAKETPNLGVPQPKLMD